MIYKRVGMEERKKELGYAIQKGIKCCMSCDRCFKGMEMGELFCNFSAVFWVGWNGKCDHWKGGDK